MLETPVWEGYRMKNAAIAAIAAVTILCTSAIFAAPPTEANASEGVLIKTVVPNSPAAQVGLKSGDRIIAINGVPIQDAFDMSWAISSHAPGARLQLHVMRNGAPINLAGTLGRAVQTAPISVRPVVRPVPAARYYYTPADINDQRAFGG
jgi:S1-C subfamily serine protease